MIRRIKYNFTNAILLTHKRLRVISRLCINLNYSLQCFCYLNQEFHRTVHLLNLYDTLYHYVTG